jgi:hypothetical protein
MLHPFSVTMCVLWLICLASEVYNVNYANVALLASFYKASVTPFYSTDGWALIC